MAAVKIIGGEDLVLPEWRVIATCAGINFEIGGAMTVAVFVDPQLNPELPLSIPTEEEFRKYANDPETIALLMKGAKPRLKRSVDTKQILNLAFGSRDHAPYFDWVLDRPLDRLIKDGQAAMEVLGRAGTDPMDLLRLLLLNLGRLKDWGELNRYNFSAYRLMVHSQVAEALSIVREHVTQDGSDDLVVIFKDRLKWRA